jgi:hypothetical protein
MNPKFLERLREGSNVVQELDAAIEAPATLLFARHLEAILRTVAAWSGTSWSDEEDEYWTIFDCKPDQAGKHVELFVGWMMWRNVPIKKIWMAVGGEGRLWNSSACRPVAKGEADELLSQLRMVIERAARNAREGVLYPFDLVTRIDASQPVLPLRPLSLGTSLLVTMPREPDANKLGWGHNPSLAILNKVLALDQKDAEQAVGKHVFEFLLFWTLISGSYCHPTKLLFSIKGDEGDAAAKLTGLALAEADVERMHPYSRVHSKTALALAEPLWTKLQALPPEMKTKVLSSMAAYRSALGVQRGVQHSVPSLAVVAYIAALESLLPAPAKCEGDIVCSVCGELQFKHDKTGHMRTVLDAVLPTLPEQRRPKVKLMLKHAYRELRSAYVHSAQTEWKEFSGAEEHWRDVTDPDDFWRKERPFPILFHLDVVVRDFIIHTLEHHNVI